jgi:hypothetical protein
MASIHLAIALPLVLSCCISFEVTMTPPPGALQPRPPENRPDLTIAVESTYAAFVDDRLQLDDLYPRNGRLGRQELAHYVMAFRATEQFRTVATGQPGNGLHCRVAVVSGREPPGDHLRTILTFGLVPTRQREIISIQATVSAPGREPATYAVEGRITMRTQGPIARQTERWSSEPECQLAACLVARMMDDGWLDRTEVRR